MKVNFFIEDVVFILKDKAKIRKWIVACVKSEGYRLSEANIIFCSDNYLLDINRNYLKHDFFTDIITFPHDNPESPVVVGGDLFLSYERIIENAGYLRKHVNDEIHRVIIHGILHLVGYTDKKSSEKKQMTARENHYLQLRDF